MLNKIIKIFIVYLILGIIINISSFIFNKHFKINFINPIYYTLLFLVMCFTKHNKKG
jgi:hypothetical protein